jgi:hypothetical protein
MKDKFIRRTVEQLNRMTLERMREDVIMKIQETKVLVEALKRVRQKEIGNDKEVGVVKVLREHESNLIQHELDLELIEEMLKEYENIEI